MSLPDGEDILRDRIGPYITAIEEFAQALPDREAIIAATGGPLRSELFTIQVLEPMLAEHMRLKENAPLSLVEVGKFFLALDKLFMNDEVFQHVFDAVFKWKHLVGSLGRSFVDTEDPRAEILIDSRKHKTAKDVIGTFLHEMVHIFIMQVQKREGILFESTEEMEANPTNEKLRGQGHGWYFQRLAAIVEKTTVKILGEHLNLGGLDAIKYESGKQGVVPDLEYFKALYEIFPLPDQPTPEGALADALRHFHEQIEGNTEGSEDNNDSGDDEEEEEDDGEEEDGETDESAWLAAIESGLVDPREGRL